MKTAKVIMISLPGMEKDVKFASRMREISDEIAKTLSDLLGEKVEVVLWNTNVKFISALEAHRLIKDLKKIQKS